MKNFHAVVLVENKMSQNCRQNENSSTSKQRSSNRPLRYKTYLCDPNVKIPRRTLYNHRKRALQDDSVNNTLHAVHQDAEQANSSIPSPVPMDEEERTQYNEDEVIDDHPDNINYEQNDGSDCGTPLFEGSNITLEMAHMLIMWYSIRHNANDSAIEDLLLLLNIFLPVPRFSTKYNFFKTYDVESIQSLKVYYCETCEVVLTNPDPKKEKNKFTCTECEEDYQKSSLDANYQFFMYLPLKPQLTKFVNSTSLYNLLQDTSNMTYSDVCNGIYYKELRQRNVISKDDLTLQVNTDGVSPFEKSQFSIWPLQVVINELPYSIRRRLMILCGLWFTKSKPIMNLFLQHFVTEMNELSNEGIYIYDSQGKEIKQIKVHVILFTVDSVARPLLQRINQFNGEYGCTFCLHQGEVVPVGNGFTRVYPGTQPSPLRSVLQHLRDGKIALDKGSPVNGVKGASVLCSLRAFDITKCFSTDYMHNILLGVVKLFIETWFNSSYHDKEWYIGNRSDEFDEKFFRIFPPKEITRTPRSIGQRKQWKANEFKYFLLYYSFPILREMLPKKYVSHWSLFVSSVHILLQLHVTDAKLEEASQYLKQFVNSIQELYGKSFYKFNVHLLMHTEMCVKNFGALWATSGFVFESYNGILAEMFFNSHGVPQQICRRYLRIKELERKMLFIDTEVWPAEVIDLLHRLMSHSVTEHLIKFTKNVKPISKPCLQKIPIYLKVEMENTVKQSINVEESEVFSSVAVRGMVIHSGDYCALMKRNNSAVLLKNGEFVFIKRIWNVTSLQDHNSCSTFLLEISPYIPANMSNISPPTSLRNIFLPVRQSNSVYIISPDDICKKAVIIPVSNELYYAVKLANPLERD